MVTVALGSTLATVVLSKTVAILDGVLAFAVLIGARYVVARCWTRWTAVDRAVKSTPALVYYRGRFLLEAMDRERLTESEVLGAIRSAGHGSLEGVEAVVLETSGDPTVVRTPGDRTLAGVHGSPRDQ